MICWKKRKTAELAAIALAVTFFGFGDTTYFATKQGGELYNKKQYGKALEQYLKAQESEPDNKRLDYNLGAAYYRTGRFDEARRAWERAAASKDKHLGRDARFNLGAALYKAGETAEKQEQIDKAIDLLKASSEQYKMLLKEKLDDNDARHNLELALSKLDKLKEKKKKQSQQKKQQKKKEKRENKKKQKNQDTKKKNQEAKKEKKTGAGNGKKEKKQAPRPGDKSITPEQAQRIFSAMERDEKNLKKKLRAKTARNRATDNGKDW